MASDRKIADIQRRAAEASRKMAESARQSPLGPARKGRGGGGGVGGGGGGAPIIKPGPDPTFDGGGGGIQQPFVAPAERGMDPQRLLERLQGAGPKRR